ncbi:MAG TPA: hypothetical protein VGW38_16440, partial [Chloroflexota bacterium]|nr:hypothetical protein [Chloroflexota bacterium]
MRFGASPERRIFNPLPRNCLFRLRQRNSILCQVHSPTRQGDRSPRSVDNSGGSSRIHHGQTSVILSADSERKDQTTMREHH